MKSRLIILGFIISINVYGQIDGIRSIKGDETGYKKTHSREAALMFQGGSIELFKKQRPNEAIKYYRKALEIDPRYVEALDNIAVCYRKIGDYSNAEAYYKKSIEIYPKGEMAHLNLAIVYQALGKLDEAICEYKYVKEINPNNPESYYGLAVIYLKTGNLNDADDNAKLARELYKRNSDPNVVDADSLIRNIHQEKACSLK
jgi:tetratricopeptide (TPR) repeat protein